MTYPRSGAWGSASGPAPLGIIRSILGGGEPMPRKYQNAKLEVRKDVARPYFFVRVTVPRIDGNGTRKVKREARPIGFIDEITKPQAMKLRAALLEAVNAPRMLAQSQMLFRDVAKRFMDVYVPQLGVAVQQRYPSQIKNHLLPAFGNLKMHEIDRPGVEEWLLAKKQAGLAPWTITGLKGVLSAIFCSLQNPGEDLRR